MAAGRNAGIRDMTVGSSAGHIIAFSLPLLAGSALQQLYNMVDSWVVGRYVGDSALAAVGIGFSVIFMFSSLFMGLSNGGTVVIAQFYGADQPDRVRDAIDTIYTAFVVSAIPITALAVLLVRPLLLFMRVEESAYQDAWMYLTVVCAGIIGTIGYNLNAGILNGLGNSRTTLLFLSVATILNIVLDLAFVILFHWNVFGVAFATILAQAVSWLFGLFYIRSHYPDFAIHPFCFRFDQQLFRKIMGIGLPAGIQMSLVSAASIIMLSKINTFGKEFTAGFNVGHKLDQMAFLPVQSLASAATAFVGQNVGANRMDRVKQGIRATLVAAVCWSLLSLVLIPLGPTLVGFFSQTPAVIQSGAAYVRCVCTFYVPFAIMFCLNNAMRGAGDSVFPMICVLMSLVFFRLPMLYWIADHYGPDYMYYGIGIGWCLGCLIASLYYFSGRWKRHGSLAAALQK